MRSTCVMMVFKLNGDNLKRLFFIKSKLCFPLLILCHDPTDNEVQSIKLYFSFISIGVLLGELFENDCGGEVEVDVEDVGRWIKSNVLEDEWCGWMWYAFVSSFLLRSCFLCLALLFWNHILTAFSLIAALSLMTFLRSGLGLGFLLNSVMRKLSTSPEALILFWGWCCDSDGDVFVGESLTLELLLKLVRVLVLVLVPLVLKRPVSDIFVCKLMW